MNVNAALSIPRPVIYPESDGKPMADNTRQARWIMVLCGNLAALFRDRPDVFVAADLLWYAVEGQPEECVAPDVLVVFGRPKGDRGSYKQWQEDDVPVTVAFEILSPKNTPLEMDDKRDFYEEHGVQEYYRYDPETNRLKANVRRGEVFRAVRPVQGFVSPLLGIRFELSAPEMTVYGPDGEKFLTFEELKTARAKAELGRQQAEQKVQKLAGIVELSRKARRGQATPEELQELERLEEESIRPPD